MQVVVCLVIGQTFSINNMFILYNSDVMNLFSPASIIRWIFCMYISDGSLGQFLVTCSLQHLCITSSDTCYFQALLWYCSFTVFSPSYSGVNS